MPRTKKDRVKAEDRTDAHKVVRRFRSPSGARRRDERYVTEKYKDMKVEDLSRE